MSGSVTGKRCACKTIASVSLSAPNRTPNDVNAIRLPRAVRNRAVPDRSAGAAGSVSDGVIWNVLTPSVCSTTRPTPEEMGLTSSCAARA